jgi:hypothetical protein
MPSFFNSRKELRFRSVSSNRTPSMNGISGVDHADGRMKRGLGPALDANYVERCPECMDFSVLAQKDPKAEPRAMTTASAMIAPTMPTITMSR